MLLVRTHGNYETYWSDLQLPDFSLSNSWSFIMVPCTLRYLESTVNKVAVMEKWKCKEKQSQLSNKYFFCRSSWWLWLGCLSTRGWRDILNNICRLECKSKLYKIYKNYEIWYHCRCLEFCVGLSFVIFVSGKIQQN
jgi:hypothetical protein